MKGLLVTALVLGLNAILTEALELTISPSGDQIKSKGLPFVITCRAKDAQGDPGLWFEDKNGRKLTNTSPDSAGRKISRDSIAKLKMYFSPVKKGAEGKYTCKGRDSGGAEKQAETTLTIFEALSCPDCETEQFPVKGTNALIKCPIKGSPPPTITWTYNNSPINFNTQRRYSADPQGMRIQNLVESDSGQYVCTGEEEDIGQVLPQTITVVVSVMPTIIGKPEIKGRPIIRGEAILSCRASGKPDPKIQFYKMNRPNTAVTGDNVVTDQSKGEMKITSLTSDWSGQYKCVAENRAGKAEALFDFTVIEPPEITEFTNTTADKGLDGNLTCYVKGTPTPTLKLQKSGESAPYSSGVQASDSRITVRDLPKDNLNRVGIQLLIKQTKPSDSSNYTCIADNSAGTYKFNGQLRIRFKPEMDKTKKEFYHWLGAVRNLTCLADAEPLPILFHWFHNGLKIDKQNGTYKLFKESKASWLQITTVKGDTNQEKWVFGQYSCNASNEAGSSSAVINVKQAIAPEEPTSAKISRTTPTTVSIEAEAPRDIGLGGIKLRGYQVLYKKADEKQWQKQDFPLTQKILVRNLEVNTQYKLRVLAYNAVGPSNNGIKLDATTLQPRKPYPIAVTSKKTSSTSYGYMLQWDVPLSGGSAILYYLVYYRPVNVADSKDQKTSYSSEKWTQVKVNRASSAKQSALEIKDLSENQSYEVKVEAVNDKGTSEVEEPFFVFRTITLAEQETGKALLGASSTIGSALLISLSVLFTLFKSYHS